MLVRWQAPFSSYRKRHRRRAEHLPSPPFSHLTHPIQRVASTRAASHLIVLARPSPASNAVLEHSRARGYSVGRGASSALERGLPQIIALDGSALGDECALDEFRGVPGALLVWMDEGGATSAEGARFAALCDIRVDLRAALSPADVARNLTSLLSTTAAST